MLPPRTPDDVLELANGFMAPRALFAAAKLGVFAALAEGPREPAAVAQELSCDARAISILLHALAALGLLEKSSEDDTDARFALAPVARECLVPGSPRDLSYYLALDADTFQSWSRLEESLRSGRPIEVSSRAARSGAPERHRAFILGMRSTALGNARIVARGLDLAALLERAPRTLLDLGGGPGTYSVELCRANPGLRATVLDLPETIAIAREVIAADAPDLLPRIDLRPADFHLDPLGGPYDVAFISHIVHGHPESTLEPLLARVRGALAPGGAIAVHDFILDESRVRPTYAALFGLNMLVMSDRGRTYAEGELRSLLSRTGFRDAERLDLGEPRGISLVVARAR